MNAALLLILAIASAYLLIRIIGLIDSLIEYWQAAPKQDGEASTAAKGTGSSR